MNTIADVLDRYAGKEVTWAMPYGTLNALVRKHGTSISKSEFQELSLKITATVCEFQDIPFSETTPIPVRGVALKYENAKISHNSPDWVTNPDLVQVVAIVNNMLSNPARKIMKGRGRGADSTVLSTTLDKG